MITEPTASLLVVHGPALSVIVHVQGQVTSDRAETIGSEIELCGHACCPEDLPMPKTVVSLPLLPTVRPVRGRQQPGRRWRPTLSRA